MKKLHIKRKKTIDERIADGVQKEVREAKREWRHLIKIRDENYLLFTAFIILLAAAIIINTVYILNHSTDNNADKSINTTITAPDSTKFLTSQQTGTNSALIVKISNVTENDKKDYAFTIAPTETMLIMNITITNSTGSIQHLIPVNQLYVRSLEGDYATLHASMYVTTPLSATELAPGKSATGQISFNVPKNIARPLLYVDTGWGNTIPLIFDVLH